MVIITNNYKVQPYNEYCYRLARRKGKTQWQTVGYYDGLIDASMALLDTAIRVDKTCVNIECASRDVVAAGLEVLVKKVDGVGRELVREVKRVSEGDEK